MDRRWEIGEVKWKIYLLTEIKGNIGDPGKILYYIKVKKSSHVVSHLHMPDKGNCIEEEEISLFKKI